MTYALEFRGIVKRFGNLAANDHIDLAINSGEIHSIVGENGAGKTTLMNILYGLYQPDSGEMYIQGRRVEFKSPADSIRAGLGMVHQQFMLFPSFTVAENVIFGSEPSRYGLIDRRTAYKKIRELSEQYGLGLDPAVKVGNLPVGTRQKVEIVKTLYRKANILILDEPTAVLTPQERDGLFDILRSLTAQGKTVLFITHKLNEVMDVSTHATVLRNGRVTANLRTVDTNPEEITRNMVGRDVMLMVEKPPFMSGPEVLKVVDLLVKDEMGHERIKGMSLNIHGGEIVGIAGVAGNGQSELVEAIVGLRPVDGGEIFLNQVAISHTPLVDRRTEISYIPEDRTSVGSAVDARVTENLMMGFQTQPIISKNQFLQNAGILKFARQLIEQFGIKVSTASERMSNLSGGNMQKAIVARELTHGHPLLVADQPTRGVDIGSIEFIYQQLINYRSDGKAILLVSADLNEIMTLSDRILVLFEGKLAGEVDARTAQENTLGLMMTGAWIGSKNG
ncbi:MAG: ABC transporter ATP-binding protein [Chloroflexi bacterium]|nr:ABC transporter ATP-binding protein [Chloroflexota bacterium]